MSKEVFESDDRMPTVETTIYTNLIINTVDWMGGGGVALNGFPPGD